MASSRQSSTGSDGTGAADAADAADAGLGLGPGFVWCGTGATSGVKEERKKESRNRARSSLATVARTRSNSTLIARMAACACRSDADDCKRLAM